SEAIESVQEPASQRSKHQKFMAELAASGKPFAVIQTEWHDYYQGLPDKEKHEVWNEFYSTQSAKPVFASQPTAEIAATPAQPFAASFDPVPKRPAKLRRPESVADLKKQLTSRVKTRGKLSRKQHLKSLAFGLGVGMFTVLLL